MACELVKSNPKLINTSKKRRLIMCCHCSRMPFYYEIKTLALLWLTLPQIDGASYVYINHLHPWLLAHETEIDLFLLSAKSRAKQAGLDYARRIWLAAREMIVREVLGQTPQGEVAGPSGQSAQSSPNQQSWFPFASSFVQQYGPSALAAGHALFHPMDQSRQVAPPGSAKATSFGTTSTSQQRRQQLEDELRSLTPPRKDTFGQSVSRPGSPRGSSGSLGALGESYETIEKEEIIALKRGSPSSSPSFTVKSTASPSPTLSHRSSWFWSGQKKGEQAKHPKSE